MSQSSDSEDFDCAGDENGSTFVATARVVPVLTRLLAEGNVEEAVHLYESADPSTAGELLERAKALSPLTQGNLAQMFAQARDFKSGAAILEGAGRASDAARMYEQGGDFAAAARCHERGGDLAKAAAAYERASRFEEALALYRRGGPSEPLAQALARLQRFSEAAQVYRDLACDRSEIEMLRRVPMADPDRVPAAKRLGDLLESHGHLAPAAQVLAEVLQQARSAKTDAELLSALVRRMEALGRRDQAAAFAEKLLVVAGQAPALPDACAAPPQGTAQASDLDAGLAEPIAAQAGAARSASGVLRGIDAYGYLKAIPIFGELALEDMKDLYRLSEEAQYSAGSTIIEQGTQGQGLFVIVDGAVQVFKIEAGRSKPLASLSAGSYVGELSLIDDAPTSARVVAAGPVRALFISRARFQQYLYTHEAAELRIYALFTRTLAERLRRANKRS